MDMLNSSTHEAALRNHHASNQTVEERDRHLEAHVRRAMTDARLCNKLIVLGRHKAERCVEAATLDNSTWPLHSTLQPDQAHQAHQHGLALCYRGTMDAVSHRWVPAGHPHYTRARKRRLWVAHNSTQRHLRDTNRTPPPS